MPQFLNNKKTGKPNLIKDAQESELDWIERGRNWFHENKNLQEDNNNCYLLFFFHSTRWALPDGNHCKACLISLTSMELIAIFSQFTVIELSFPFVGTLTVTRTCVPPEMVRPANLYVDTPSGRGVAPI